MGASLNSRPRLDYINSMLSGADLRFLVDTLMPGTADKAKMFRALREDEEILEGVLKDGRLVERILEDPEAAGEELLRLFHQLHMEGIALGLSPRNLLGPGGVEQTAKRVLGASGLLRGNAREIAGPAMAPVLGMLRQRGHDFQVCILPGGGAAAAEIGLARGALARITAQD